MTPIRILGIILIIAGGVLFCFSEYIATQVAEGEGKVQSAQGQVDTANSLFSLTPYSKQIGNTLTNPAQKKINAGSIEIAQYRGMIQPLKYGGIGCIIIGILLLILGRKTRRST
jgi:hypothetical protein